MALSQTRLSKFKRSALLFLLAMMGVPIVIFSVEIPAFILEQSPFDENTLKLISFVQSTVFVAIAVLIGNFTAHRVGLTSLIVHSSKSPHIHHNTGAKTWTKTGAKNSFAFLIYAALGIMFGILIFIGDGLIMKSIPSLNALTQSPDFASLPQPSLVARFLYGGITEEVLLRWGLMSFLAFILFAIFKNKTISIGISIIISAILFGLGHLPALNLLFEEVPIAFTIKTVCLNSILGIFYGLTYARTNLETGMVAHAATHIGLLTAPNLGLFSSFL